MSFDFLSLSGLVTAVLSFLLAGMLLTYQGKESQHRALAIFSVLVAVWGVGIFFAFSLTKYSQVLFFSRFLNLTAIFIPLSFINFVRAHVKKVSLKSKYVRLIYGITIGYFAISISFVDFFIPTIKPVLGFAYYPVAGVLYPFFPIWYTVVVLIGIGMMVLEYKQSDSYVRERLKYLFLALSIGFSGGSTTFFPVFGIQIYPFGAIGVVMLNCVFVYAITKHDLLDIKIAISKGVAQILSLVALLAAYLCVSLRFRYVGEWGNGVLTMASIALIIVIHPHLSRFLFTSIEKKFLQGYYDTEKVLSQINKRLVGIDERVSLARMLVHVLTQEMELAKVKVVMRSETTDGIQIAEVDFFEEVFLDGDNVMQREVMFGRLEALGARLNPINLSVEVKDILRSVYSLDDKITPMLLTSHKGIEGLLFVRGKLTEDALVQRDLDVLDAIVHECVLVFDRMNKTDELQALNESLAEEIRLKVEENKLVWKAAEKMSHQAALSTMTMGVSHEIRNPLFGLNVASANLRTALSAMGEGVPDLVQEVSAYIDEVNETATRIKNISDAMLTFGTVEDLKKVPMVLEEAIFGMHKVLETVIKGKRVDIVYALSDEGHTALIEPTRLSQVIVNTLNNSIHAFEAWSGRSEVLVFTIRTEGVDFLTLSGETVSGVRILLSDNGPGISESLRERIFDPFFSTKDPAGGQHIGLGLAIVMQIVNDHEGRIRVLPPEPGQGAVFEIVLPCCDGPVAKR